MAPKNLAISYHPNGKKHAVCHATMRLRSTLPGDEGLTAEDEQKLLSSVIRRALQLLDEPPSNEAVQYHINSMLEPLFLAIDNLDLHLPEGE